MYFYVYDKVDNVIVFEVTREDQTNYDNRTYSWFSSEIKIDITNHPKYINGEIVESTEAERNQALNKI